MNSDQQHADEFNELYSTNFNLEEYILFINYRDHHGLNTEDALEYIQTCHSCNTNLDIFASDYCCDECHYYVEEQGLVCFRGTDCLICNRDTGKCYCCNVDKIHDRFCDIPTEWPTPNYCSDRCFDAGYWVEVPDFLQEVTQFNENCNVSLNQYHLKKLKLYAIEARISAEDALVYYSQCHCCGYYKYGSENEFQLYCSERCRKAIEDDGFECIHTSTCRDCLICNNSGRTYDENSVHPDFVELPKNTCDDCASEFIYPPFEYCVDDEVYNTETIYSVCNTCFCRNSSYRRRHVQSYPVKNHACHDPHVSALYCCRELKVFIDLIVREDLCQYMYEM